MHLESVFAVPFVNLAAPVSIIFSNFAQSLPANLQQFSFFFSKNTGGARHPAQRCQLAKEGAMLKRRGLVVVKHGRNILYKHMGRGRIMPPTFTNRLSAIARGIPQLRLSAIGPQL